MSDESRDTSKEGLERRDFIKGAVTVAWATPLVLTMSAGQAGAQTMSCIPINMACDACQGMQCCDTDGPQDGGCCCSPAVIPPCGGICLGTDADCDARAAQMQLQLTCYVPAPP